MTAVQVSTLLMTTLLGVGLFFFIRAASKDRTQQRRYQVGIPMGTLGPQLYGYAQSHGFRLQGQDEQQRAVFVGMAQPSEFLAVFLSLLTLVGVSCGVMVIRSLYPSLGGIPWLLVVLAPWAGAAYRRRMQRQEVLKIWLGEGEQGSLLHLEGQRDELDRLEAYLGLS
ncbi:MAG: cofactor assembly of complex C subunit B [Thermostichales cyanobacterium SZTDM-1c_bins_54]